MHPPAQLYEYGAVPPEVFDVTVPLEFPKQSAEVEERLGTMADGGLTVTLEVATQPFASVTVIE